MADFGYTVLGEQVGPRQSVRDVRAAEEAGFDFAVFSDHYFPWLERQGHSPYVWSVLGAAAQVTDSIPLMTFVTCPLLRYHPVVVAQKATTVQLLADGRFTLGLGTGENLNEHVVGAGWPVTYERQDMLAEAVQIIRALWTGDYVNFSGDYYRVEAARVWDLPDVLPPIGIAVSGPRSCRLAGELGDAMIAVQPERQLVERFEQSGGRDKPRMGQVVLCYDTDENAALQRAWEQFRWFAGGWKVNAELPGPAGFDAATQFVREDDIAAQIPCGPNLEHCTQAVQSFLDAGYTHIALVQVGGDHQTNFLQWAEKELLPELREL